MTYNGPEEIPLCAYSPIQNIINNAGCQVTETSCFCAKPDIVAQFASAVVPACDGTVNSADVSSFASSFCVIPSSAAATTSVSKSSTPADATTTTGDVLSTASATAGVPLSFTVAATTSANVTTSKLLSATPTNGMDSTTSAASPDESAGHPNLGVSALALAIAVAGMTWLFGELP